MRTEYTRQTRWAESPDLVDPKSIPPGATYVREMIWVPCLDCDLQVHAAYSRVLAAGVTCPECGRQLAAAASAEERDAAMGKVSATESQFRQRLTS